MELVSKINIIDLANRDGYSGNVIDCFCFPTYKKLLTFCFCQRCFFLFKAVPIKKRNR